MILPRKDGSLIRVPCEMNKFVCFERKVELGMDNFLDTGLGNYVVLQDVTNRRPTNEISNGIWKIYFDGACSKNGSGIGLIIEIPNAKINTHAYKLQLKCTNNEAKYEALIQGLELERNISTKHICVFGDFELVINKVKKRYIIKKCRLKAYARKFWDFTESFQAFNIKFIHREKNQREESLEVTASMFIPNDSEVSNSFKVSTLY